MFLEKQVTLIRNTKTTKPEDFIYVSFQKVIERILLGQKGLDKLTEKAVELKAGDPKVYREWKANTLPAMIPAGVFDQFKDGKASHASYAWNGQHTGLIALDFDDVDDLPTLKQALQELPYIVFEFTSPSGKGCKPFVLLDTPPNSTEEHKDAWEQVKDAVEKEVGQAITIDKQCKNLNRLCYLSYAPIAYLDEKGVGYKNKPRATHSIPKTARKQKNEIPTDAEAREVLNHISADDREEWINIGHALKQTGLPFAIWDEWSRTSPNFDPSEDMQKRWDGLKPDGSITWGSVVHKAQQNGYELRKSQRKRKSKPNPVKDAKDKSSYFLGDDQFNVLAMSEHIQENFTVWAQDSGIYIYDAKTGIYVPGELDIDREIRKELQDLRKKNYVEEVLADLRACCRRNVPDNSHLIAFKNGVLRLNLTDGDVGNFSEHSPQNYLMSTFPIHFDMNPAVTDGSKDFDQWLLEVLEDDGQLVRIIYEVIGSIFHQDSVAMQRGILMIGEGGTGKSMLLSQIQRIIGRENICARAWGDYGFSEFAFGDLYGKALALDSDIDVNRPLSGAIKPAITGNILTCNKKYQQPFDFNPFATWIGSINKFPKTKDKTWGFFRRWITIPFDKSYPTNSKFEAEKRELWSQPETISRIVHDAISLYVLAYRNGTYTVPDVSKSTRTGYVRSSKLRYLVGRYTHRKRTGGIHITRRGISRLRRILHKQRMGSR